MADQSDVEIALCSAIGAALYGATSPQTAIPTVGAPVTVFRGWPGSVKLDAVLQAATPSAMVSVFTRNESERTVSRYPMTWQDASGPAIALTAVVAGRQVTFGGACSPLPLNVAVALPSLTYTYAVQAGDTPASVAAYFAGAIPGATAAGSVLTCNTPPRLVTIGGAGPAVQEVRRQVKQFSVTLWTPSPVIRDAIASVIDPALATLFRLPLPDNTVAVMRYAWSRSDDGLQRANCFRRDFAYNIEYATTNTQTFYQVVTPSTSIASLVTSSYVSPLPPLYGIVPASALLNASLSLGAITLQLSGSAASGASVSGVLTSSIVAPVALAGAVGASPSLAGAFSTSLALTGVIAATPLLGGGLTSGVSFYGTVGNSALISSSLSVSISLAGSALGGAAIAATLASGVALSGSIAATPALAASLSANVALSGAITANPAPLASLSATVSLVGAIAAIPALNGGIVAGVALSGLAGGGAAIVGGLTVGVALNGVTTGGATLTSVLSNSSTVSFVGTVAASPLPHGALTTSVALVATSTANAALSGALSAGVALAGAASPSPVASGALAVSASLTAVSSASPLPHGSLTVSTALVATATASTYASGTITVVATTSGILLEDGASYLTLEDGVSNILPEV